MQGVLEPRDVSQDKRGLGAGNQAEPVGRGVGKVPQVRFRHGFLRVRDSVTGILAEAWNASIKPRLGHDATECRLGA